MWEGDCRLEPYFLEPTERTERTKRTTREKENRQAVKKKNKQKTEKPKPKHSPDRPLKKEEKDQETGSRQTVGKSEGKNPRPTPADRWEKQKNPGRERSECPGAKRHSVA
jgi:hypothetical protein